MLLRGIRGVWVDIDGVIYRYNYNILSMKTRSCSVFLGCYPVIVIIISLRGSL